LNYVDPNLYNGKSHLKYNLASILSTRILDFDYYTGKTIVIALISHD